MSLAKYYSSNKALTYHPARVLAERRGLRRLIAYDDRFSAVLESLTKLVKLINGQPVRILDIGVGDGVYEKALTEKGIEAEFYGVDISAEQLKRAEKWLKDSRQVDFDSESLPYQDNFFDIVLVSEVLEHLFSPEKLLGEANKVLKKTGYLVLTYPNSGSLQLRLALLFWGWSPLLNYPKNKEHIRFFNKEGLSKLIPLSVVKYQGLGSFLFAKWNFPVKIIMPRFLQILGNRLLPQLGLGHLLILQK